MSNGSLALISVASKEEIYTITTTLHQLGFEVHNTVPGDESEPSEKQNVFVLYTGSNSHQSQKLVDQLTDLPALPILGIFDSIENSSDVELKKYCTDYVCWPWHSSELADCLKKLTDQSHLDAAQSSGALLIEEKLSNMSLPNMVGKSPEFKSTITRIKKIANCDAGVLIEGETGTGKEVAARAVHYLSSRKDYPFIPVNCGALPDSLFDAEMFGHEQGAFTDAKSARDGLIKQADSGTLFLDEVDSLSAKAQVALLRFLQDGSYRPLGGQNQYSADVRIVSASNSNLLSLCEQGLFRQDLYFRLNIVSLQLPSLRSRTGDVELLAKYYINKYSRQYKGEIKTIHKDTLDWMVQYSWPGNIRELENTLHREYLLSDGLVINFKDAMEKTQTQCRRKNSDRRLELDFADSFSNAKTKIVSEFERRYLTWVMSQTQGNVSAAAKRAGKERRAFGRLLKKHQIERANFCV